MTKRTTMSAAEGNLPLENLYASARRPGAGSIRLPGPGRARVALAAALLSGSAAFAAAATKPARAPADPDLPAQRRICFPQAASGGVKTFRADGLILWTDAAVDGAAVFAHLRKVERYLRAGWPPAGQKQAGTTRPASAPPARARPVAVAIYAAAADYQALWRRVAAYYRGRFGAIRTQGYSYRVFCATSYDSAEKFAARRSVICHEFAHVWLYQRHRLRNDGNWLTEGVATAVQLHFFPDSGNRRDFARWMAAGRMLPLKRLMSLPRIEPKDYWQAGTLIELLRLRYADKLPEVVAAFNRGKSPYSIITQTLKTDFSTLENQWAEHVRRCARPTSRPAK